VIASKSGFKEKWMMVRVSLKARVQEGIIFLEREREMVQRFLLSLGMDM
jgi:hypothetical protein